MMKLLTHIHSMFLIAFWISFRAVHAFHVLQRSPAPFVKSLRKMPIAAIGGMQGRSFGGDEEQETHDILADALGTIGESDWAQSELTLRNAPTAPSPDLTAETVVLTVCRSLQWVDYPTPSAGLERCFPFLTFECRKTVTARRGGSSVERFCQFGALAPALQPFMGAYRIDLGQSTFTPAKPPLRGALLSIGVRIQGAPILSLKHPSGLDRAGVAPPHITNMVIRLEQQRRPPDQGCWLVREILDVRHAFAGDMGNAHVGA